MNIVRNSLISLLLGTVLIGCAEEETDEATNPLLGGWTRPCESGATSFSARESITFTASTVVYAVERFGVISLDDTVCNSRDGNVYDGDYSLKLTGTYTTGDTYTGHFYSVIDAFGTTAPGDAVEATELDFTVTAWALLPRTQEMVDKLNAYDNCSGFIVSTESSLTEACATDLVGVDNLPTSVGSVGYTMYAIPQANNFYLSSKYGLFPELVDDRTAGMEEVAYTQY